MELKLGLCLIAVGYCIVYFFDSFFKSCAHYPYIKFLEGTGLKINFFNVQWTTTAFNRTLLRFGSARNVCNSKFLHNWFSAGTIATLVLLPVAISLLVYSFAQNFAGNSQNDVLLKPVVPGFNLPASEIWYYSLTLIISSIVHEFGHALAAVKEDVQVVNIGLNVLFILPVAFVNLSSENLKSLEPKRRLRILTAGVWHNLVLSFCCYGIYLASPVILSVVFRTGAGVAVYDSSKTSPLIGDKGLELGDVITRFNDCNVDNEEGWYACLESSRKKPGLCFHPDSVREFDETGLVKHTPNGLFECCDPSKVGNVCFELLDDVELPSHVCLPVRKMLTGSKSFKWCSNMLKCSDRTNFCFMPQLNRTGLYKLEVWKNVGEKKTVIYMGLIEDFTRTLRVSSFTPKLFESPGLAECVRKFLQYSTVISLGLGLVNIIPCFCMDGQHILDTLFYMKFARNGGDVSTMICLVFTLLLIVHCVLTMLPMFSII